MRRYDLLRGIKIVRLGLYALGVVTLLAGGLGVMALGLMDLTLTLLQAVVLVFLIRRLLPALRLTKRLGGGNLRGLVGYSVQVFFL